MRITKLPIPLLIAAAALTSVAVIYVYLTGPSLPIYTDPNFTGPLFIGGTYLWRGAAFEYIFSADDQISVSYVDPYHLVYLFGPLYNITLSGRMAIVYGVGIRPIYVVKHDLVTEDGRYSFTGTCLVFKLRDVTPENSTIGNLTVYLPEIFNVNDVLTDAEDMVIYRFAGCSSRFRVVQVQVNGTHILFQTAYTYSNSLAWKLVMPLQSLASGRTVRATNTPLSGSYIVGSTTYTVMALPYLHFVITPLGTTTLTIYVS
jgi:hypothetical protein